LAGNELVPGPCSPVYLVCVRMPYGGALDTVEVMPINDAQRQLFAERVAAMDATVPGYARMWERWEAKLLADAGDGAVPPMVPEPDLEALLASAEVVGAVAQRFEPGETNRCHANASKLWLLAFLDDEDCGIGTGYALSGDGLWRQHSWFVDRNGSIVETTVRRDSYAGIVLYERDALAFAWANNRELVERILAHPAVIDALDTES